MIEKGDIAIRSRRTPLEVKLAMWRALFLPRRGSWGALLVEEAEAGLKVLA
jgi:hypothetical protein